MLLETPLIPTETNMNISLINDAFQGTSMFGIDWLIYLFLILLLMIIVTRNTGYFIYVFLTIASAMNSLGFSFIPGGFDWIWDTLVFVVFVPIMIVKLAMPEALGNLIMTVRRRFTKQ